MWWFLVPSNQQNDGTDTHSKGPAFGTTTDLKDRLFYEEKIRAKDLHALHHHQAETIFVGEEGAGTAEAWDRYKRNKWGVRRENR